MQHKEKTISAGLAFLQAAALAIPRTMGDRDRIEAMSEAMQLAVKNRFSFDKSETQQLLRLGIETSVGVFRPMDYYLLACASGGTYARMWEAHHNQKAWVAARALFPEYLNGTRQRTFLDNNRIAPRVAVLLPATFAPEEPELASFEGSQVWWVTSQTDDVITLCRYRVTKEAKARGEYYAPFVQTGAPARRRKLSREEWATWNDKAEATPEQLAA
nr:hypothetical protein [Paraburkholderia aspalathi]